MKNNKKRQPIKKKLFRVVIIITFLSILISSLLGIIFILKIRNDNTKALIKQVESSMNDLINAKTKNADAKLSIYLSHVEKSARHAELILHNKDYFKKQDVPQIDNSNTENQLQRSFKDKNVKVEDVLDELNYMANIVTTWLPIKEEDEETITSLYLATECGYMLSWDRYASTMEKEENGESYFDYMKRPWYISAIENSNAKYGDLDIDYYGRGLTLTCSAPIKKDGKFYGAASIDILVSDLQKELLDVDLGEGSYAFIINKYGEIIASPDINQYDENFLQNNKERNIIKNENGIFYDIGNDILLNRSGFLLEDDGNYVGFNPISSTGWIYCICIPETTVLEPIILMNNNIRVLLITFIVSFLIMYVIAAFVIRDFSTKLTNPIEMLTKDTKIVAEGNFDYKIQTNSNDEISDLANSFNFMTSSIKKYINDLTNVTKEKERIGAELNVATEIQASMLPNVFPAFPDVDAFDIYAFMTPAKEVGGDFYDFFMVDEKHLAIVVADVSGKGVPAALFMVIGKTLIKDHTSLSSNLGNVFTNVNNLLCEANEAGLFITAFEAVIDLSNGDVQYVNAGHEMPFIYNKVKGFKPFTMKSAFVLAGMQNMTYKTGSFKIEPGDKIFQYTDGVTEATNSNNELYGMQRLEKVLNENHEKNPKGLISAVKEDIDGFVAGAPQFDDITMLAVDIKKFV